MVSPVISKIVAMQQSFTVSENEIAQYVIHNADAVVASTITTIAQNTNTSEASINRFCKKIGFKGFNAFKIALAQENFFNSMRESDADNSDALVGAISRDYRNMLANTTTMLGVPPLPCAKPRISISFRRPMPALWRRIWNFVSAWSGCTQSP